MDWTEALDIVVARTRHEPYRELCAQGNPHHETWRARIVAMATGQAAPAPSYPSLARMAGNALGAVGRVVAAAASGKATVVDAEEQARRLDICQACPEFDAAQGRCRKCGCVARWKARLASEHCPLDPPRW